MPQVVLRIINKPNQWPTRARQASCEQANGAAPARPARRAIPVNACRPQSAESGTNGCEAQARNALEHGPAEGLADAPAERERAGSGVAATVPGDCAPLAALRAAKPYRPALSPQQSPAGAASPGPGVAPGMSEASDADAALGSVAASAGAAMYARTSQLLGACASGLGAANCAWAEHGRSACQADEQPGSSCSSSFTHGGLPDGPLRSASSSFTHGGGHADLSLGSSGNSQGSATGSHADLDGANGAALGELAWMVRDAGGGARSPGSGLGSASPVHAAREGAGNSYGGCPSPGAQLAAHAAACRLLPEELRPHSARATAQAGDGELCVIRATSSNGGTGRVLSKPRPVAMDALLPAAAAPSAAACSPPHDATEGDVPPEAWEAARQRLALSGAHKRGLPSGSGLWQEPQAHSNGCGALLDGMPEAREPPVLAQCQHATAQAAEAAAAEQRRRTDVAEAAEQKRVAEKAAAEQAAAAAATERQRLAVEESRRRAAAEAAEQKRAAEKAAAEQAAAEQAAATAAAARAAAEERQRRAAAVAAEQKRAAEKGRSGQGCGSRGRRAATACR